MELARGSGKHDRTMRRSTHLPLPMAPSRISLACRAVTPKPDSQGGPADRAEELTLDEVEELRHT
jgi:hypothetical protein